MSNVKSKILQHTDQRLHTKSVPVTDFAEAKQITEKLVEVTKQLNKPWVLWLGMAAPQIGYNKRVILLKRSHKKYTIMINPEILEEKNFRYTISRCYSVPGIFLVKAPFWTKITYQNLDKNRYTEIITGGKSATLQQEVDHINGVLLPDRGKKLI